MRLPPPSEKTVLITGCSTGIGAATALFLKGRGWTVFPTARKEDDLDRLRSEGFHPIRMDMADAESVAAGADEVLERTGGQLDALVNNAGFAQSGAIEDIQGRHLRHQFEVNVFGLQDLTNRLIPLFRKQGHGRIVHISSVVGRISIPFLGAYSASKFAVEALADAQRVELRGSGVGVILIEPGPIITEFRRTAARHAKESLDWVSSRNSEFYAKELQRRESAPKKENWINKTPEDVAVKIAHALESPRPRRRYPITLPARLGECVRRFVPAAWSDGILARKLPNHYGEKE